jgi:two-component sensor histidine kinase/ActR/RegA family two-component response regulator
MRSWPVRAWLIVLTAVSILPLLIAAIVFSIYDSFEDQGRNLARVQETTRAFVRAVDGLFESRIALLQGLATSVPLQQGNYPVFRQQAEFALRSLPANTGIILADAKAQQLINTYVPESTPLPRRVRVDVVEGIFATGRPSVSNVFVGAFVHRLVVSIDVPVIIDGRVRYDLALILPIEDLNALLREQKIPETWFAGVLDRDGILAARLPHPELYVGKPAAALLQEGIKARVEGRVETPTLEGVEVVSTWTRSDRFQWAVAIAVPKDVLTAPLYRHLLGLLLAGLLVAAIGVVLAYLLGSSITTRLVQLQRRAQALSSDETLPALPAGIREIDLVDERLRAANETIRDQRTHQRMLMAELDHRVKNILATVQALVSRTLGRSDLSKAIVGRIGAIAEAHNLLGRTYGRGAFLKEIVEVTLGVHRMDPGRIRISGPDVVLKPKATQAIMLALHELATNAVKYGALSVPTGHVEVVWSVSDDEQRHLHLQWSEHNGPKVDQPGTRGFGSKLIEDNLPREILGSVSLDFRPSGLICRVEASLDEIQGDGGSSLSVANRADAPADVIRLEGLQILLVEDDSLVAMEVMALLEQEGCNVIIASRVQTAVALTASLKLDAAILDVNIHGAMVFPVAAALKQRHVPFVFLTGYDDPQLWPDDLQAITRLSKPVQPAELLAGLSLIVRQSRMRAAESPGVTTPAVR